MFHHHVCQQELHQDFLHVLLQQAAEQNERGQIQWSETTQFQPFCNPAENWRENPQNPENWMKNAENWTENAENWMENAENWTENGKNWTEAAENWT